MNPELEALVLARDAVLMAGGGAEAKERQEQYLALIEGTLELHPGLSRESLRRMIELTHARWLKAEKKFPTVPPKA